ncbi:MAG: acetolactate synthase small subunit [Candidatus Coatesbacteria bacterium]
MRHTISVLVENKPGVLARVSGLFASRGFNIESLAVGETEDPTVSRMTIVSSGEDATIEQIAKQLNKLVDVIKVNDLTAERFVERELFLVRVAAEGHARAELIQLVDVFRAKIVDVAAKSVTVELTGATEKIEAFVDLMRQFGIKEMVRTGKVALIRAPREGKSQ